MFFPAGTPAPVGYDVVDVPACTFGTCWLYGRDKDMQALGEAAHDLCVAPIERAGHTTPDADVYKTSPLHCCGMLLGLVASAASAAPQRRCARPVHGFRCNSRSAVIRCRTHPPGVLRRNLHRIGCTKAAPGTAPAP